MTRDGGMIPTPPRRFEDKNPPPENKEAPCNICGRGWPYHEASCAYKQTAEEAARYREALRLLIPTGDGGFVVIEHAEYESVKAVVDEVQGVR